MDSLRFTIINKDISEDRDRPPKTGTSGHLSFDRFSTFSLPWLLDDLVSAMSVAGSKNVQRKI